MPPLVLIPKYFDGPAMPRVAADVERLIAEQGTGCEIAFDFSRLGFVRPAGVVFLTNLAHWLKVEGCTARFLKPFERSEACDYLDDSEFFLEHCGSRFWDDSRVRSTSLPLQRIKHEHIHHWLTSRLIPWLTGALGVTPNALADLKVSISELFNNINEHTKYDIGSIFVQHYPNEKRIRIVLADFGGGIPSNVKRVYPDIGDGDAIVKATENGFTSKSIKTNQGYGLDILLKTVVERNRGWVTIFSGAAIVSFEAKEHLGGTKMEPSIKASVGICPGTTIEIKLRTDKLVEPVDEEQDFEW